jgi:cobalt-zinc-cadmium efflux system protein
MMEPSGAHGHTGTQGVKGKNLLIAALLNLFIAVAEIAGGIISNSLSLLSDALHNLGDGLAVFLAWIAHRISKRPSNARRTFGYKRIEILAALFNAFLLAVLTIYLFYEAVLRILDPEPIKGLIMLVVAGIGLLANLAAVVLLKKDSGKNINVRAAYLHLVSDTLSSLAVIAGGVLIYFFNLYWIDPLITIAIGIYILAETWHILRQANDILMQGTPAGLNLDEIRAELEKIPGVGNVHHVHSWNLDDRSIHYECHIDLDRDLRLSEVEPTHHRIQEVLKDKFGIGHVTVQFEFGWCDDNRMIH